MDYRVDRFRQAQSKILGVDDLAKRVDEAKKLGQTVVFTNGCFDILHLGHVRYLEAARRLGDLLVVGINTDSTVRKLKGPGRPVNSEFERLEVLASLESVDYVTLFAEDLPIDIILAVKPSIHAKGGDYTLDDLPEADAVKQVGGITRLIPFESTETQGKSTTSVIERIMKGRENAHATEPGLPGSGLPLGIASPSSATSGSESDAGKRDRRQS